MKPTQLSKQLMFSFSFVTISLLILLVATIAWFTINPNFLGDVELPVNDPIFETKFYVGIDLDYDNIVDELDDIPLYTEISPLFYEIDNWQPGQYKHFKIAVTNYGLSPIVVSFDVENITDGDDNENILTTVFYVDLTHPNIPARSYVDEQMSELMAERLPMDGFMLANDVVVGVNQTIELHFTFKFVPASSGDSNPYQRLTLIIGKFTVTAM